MCQSFMDLCLPGIMATMPVYDHLLFGESSWSEHGGVQSIIVQEDKASRVTYAAIVGESDVALGQEHPQVSLWSKCVCHHDQVSTNPSGWTRHMYQHMSELTVFEDSRVSYNVGETLIQNVESAGQKDK